jgi:hypothetical protein
MRNLPLPVGIAIGTNCVHNQQIDVTDRRHQCNLLQVEGLEFGLIYQSREICSEISIDTMHEII